MQRVAFDFRRPSFVAFDQKSCGDAANGHRRRVKQRSSRDQVLRLPDVRNDLLWRLSRTCSHARERHRRTHQLEERAPRDRIGNRFNLRRKLVVQTLLKSGIAGAFFERAPKAANRVGTGDLGIGDYWCL